MTSASAHLELWSLVQGAPSIDPAELLQAIDNEVHRSPLDFRTRLLVRDGIGALTARWGAGEPMRRLSPGARRPAHRSVHSRQ